MTERRVAGSGVELAVFERGDTANPTVVLVHGFPDTHVMWDPVAELLASRFHVVAYDVRGTGASSIPPRERDYVMEFLMEDLTAVIDTVSPREPVHLVGHDWGSIQGWDAVCHPLLDDRIASYTSISGPSLDHAAQWIRERVRRPVRETTKVPIQLVVPLRDRYVSTALLEGMDRVAPDLTRRDLDAGHWVPRTHPQVIADLIADFATKHAREAA